MAIPKIRKTADSTIADIRSVSYEIYDAETDEILFSGSMSHVASMVTNPVLRQIFNNLLEDYLDANNLNESSGGFPAKLTQQQMQRLIKVTASNHATAADTNPISLGVLNFNYQPTSLYRIWFMGKIQPDAAGTGCAFQFDLSSTVGDLNLSFSHQLANTGTLSGGHSIADDVSVGISSGFPGTSAYPVQGNGLLRTNANAGTAQLRMRSEVAGVITALAGFTLVVEKLI